MRIRSFVLLATLPVAVVLTGCGVGAVESPSAATNVAGATIKGKLFGGQQPIIGATVNLYAAGTSGYGGASTILAQTQTLSDGSYEFVQPNFTCPQSNTPLYVLAIGGAADASGDLNQQAVLGAALGTCGNLGTVAANGVVINEVTTVSLAYSMAHFFNRSTGSSTLSGVSCYVYSASSPGYAACPSATFSTTDTIGGPSTTSSNVYTYSVGLRAADTDTAPVLVNVGTGTANATPTISGGTAKVETGKIYALANSLASCVNSASTVTTSNGTTTYGPSSACSSLFGYTTSPNSGTGPTDTLQAAVNVARYPYQNVTNIFNLGSSTTFAFSGAQLSAPPDWSLGVSYTSTAYGLTVASGAVSTIDIDASGNVWFPSNTASAPGFAYWSPSTSTFSSVFNPSSKLVDPTQVAIDKNGYVWADDLSGTFLVGSDIAGDTVTKNVAGMISAVTINSDDSVRFGLTVSGSYEEADYLSGSFSTLNTTFTAPLGTIAGGPSNSDVLAQNVGSALTGYTVDSTGSSLSQAYSATAYTGQATYTTVGFVGLAASTGSGNSSLCFNSNHVCTSLYSNGAAATVTVPTYGAAVDGNNTLWITESTGKLLGVPLVTGNTNTYVSSSGYVQGNELDHTTALGGSTITSPYGVAVDSSGNVWVSNANASGSFTLTELIGLGYPTITPVSAQITSGSVLTGTRPQQ